jgi:hypothetical protein
VKDDMMMRISVLLLAAFVCSPALARAQAAPRFDVASLKERDRNIPVGLVEMQATPGRPVIDKTGLPGTYYFDVKYAGDNSPNSSLPSLEGALKEQFGLELKAETGPVEVLVIDRAEKPTPT